MKELKGAIGREASSETLSRMERLYDTLNRKKKGPRASSPETPPGERDFEGRVEISAVVLQVEEADRDVSIRGIQGKSQAIKQISKLLNVETR